MEKQAAKVKAPAAYRRRLAEPGLGERTLTPRPGGKPDVEAENLVARTMTGAEPDRLGNTLVRLGYTDPVDDFQRVWNNPQLGPVGRGLGLLTHAPSALFGNPGSSEDMEAGGPWYDRHADVAFQPWDAPAATMHELGHAIDLNSTVPKSWIGRQLKGTANDLYSGLSPSLWKEHAAWRKGERAMLRGAIQDGVPREKVRKIMGEGGHAKPPALGSYWGGALGAVGGGLLGLLAAAYAREKGYRGPLRGTALGAGLGGGLGGLAGLGIGSMFRDSGRRKAEARVDRVYDRAEARKKSRPEMDDTDTPAGKNKPERDGDFDSETEPGAKRQPARDTDSLRETKAAGVGTALGRMGRSTLSGAGRLALFAGREAGPSLAGGAAGWLASPYLADEAGVEGAGARTNMRLGNAAAGVMIANPRLQKAIWGGGGGRPVTWRSGLGANMAMLGAPTGVAKGTDSTVGAALDAFTRLGARANEFANDVKGQVRENFVVPVVDELRDKVVQPALDRGQETLQSAVSDAATKAQESINAGVETVSGDARKAIADATTKAQESINAGVGSTRDATLAQIADASRKVQSDINAGATQAADRLQALLEPRAPDILSRGEALIRERLPGLLAQPGAWLGGSGLGGLIGMGVGGLMAPESYAVNPYVRAAKNRKRTMLRTLLGLGGAAAGGALAARYQPEISRLLAPGPETAGKPSGPTR